MKLVFLGTRGEIERRTPRHGLHSSLLLEHGRAARVMIDCGLDWLGRLEDVAPFVVVLTHAHVDHAGGLRAGAPCPVYATEATLHAIRRYGVDELRLVEPRCPFNVEGIIFEAFPVAHSLLAPAVGYRVTAGGVSFFYVPDVVSIHHRRAALSGIALYVGDGASLTRPIVRRRDGVPIGHAPIRTQLDWCAKDGVARAIFTHCGSEIVRADPAMVAARVGELGRELGVDASIARDGMEISL
jgi:phosphoribosyl 1,2-cyclic phosphodiesterase